MGIQETFSSKAHYEWNHQDKHSNIENQALLHQASFCTLQVSLNFIAIVLSHLQATHCLIVPDIALTRLYGGNRVYWKKARDKE